jgi:hypothetical protein
MQCRVTRDRVSRHVSGRCVNCRKTSTISITLKDSVVRKLWSAGNERQHNLVENLLQFRNPDLNSIPAKERNLQSLKISLTQGGESAVTRQGRGDHRRWTWDR